MMMFDDDEVDVMYNGNGNDHDIIIICVQE